MAGRTEGQCMSVRCAVVHEAEADFQTATELADRVLVEAIEWLDEDLLDNNALASAAKLLEPRAQSVSLPSGTIKNEDDLKTWLDDAEERIRDKLKDGPVIV